jgi:hypothetical protein
MRNRYNAIKHPFLFPRSEALCCRKKETLRLDELEDNEVLEVVTQTTTRLPFLDDEVPILYLSDGRPYIPVFALCHALGIRPDIHTRRWRRLVLWVIARKLPFHTEKPGRRLVWCLLISEVPFRGDYQNLPPLNQTIYLLLERTSQSAS